MRGVSGSCGKKHSAHTLIAIAVRRNEPHKNRNRIKLLHAIVIGVADNLSYLMMLKLILKHFFGNHKMLRYEVIIDFVQLQSNPIISYT